MLLLLAPAALAACLSCRDEPLPTGPAGHRVLAQQSTASDSLRGCLRLRIQANPTATAVQLDSLEHCPGSALVLELDTTAVFDPVRRVLRLPLVLRNAAPIPAAAPARVVFRTDSVRRLAPDGSPLPGPSPTYGQWPLDAGSSNSGHLAIWSYDTLLPPAGAARQLAPGERSGRRWLELRGSDWGTTLVVRFDVSAALGYFATAPATPPDLLPDWLTDSSNFAYNATYSPDIPFTRDVILVQFKPTASAQDRAQAIAGVAGVVVGGVPGRGRADGFYIIQLPRDTLNERVFTAIRALESLPAISGATINLIFIGSLNYLRPRDESAAWSPHVWRLSKDSGYAPAPLRPTSALEAVNAPFAWGCSTGSPSIRVGVLDAGLHLAGMPDLQANHGDTTGVDLPNDNVQHGTRVASVLAARGDNRVGMAGMMWFAHLDLRDIAARDSAGRVVRSKTGLPTIDRVVLSRELGNAVKNGDRVINLSIGAPFAGGSQNPSPQYDASLRNDIGVYASVIRYNAPPTRPPLIVVSGGNNAGVNPYFSQFPVLADSLPDQVLVVAASGRTPRTALFAPTGAAYINVAAPGEAVGVWDENGPGTDTGASFSAPLVAGAAGLLLAFDSTLTTKEVRDFIILGAQRGGTTANGFPVLDAYESLRLAASRKGAPLCGNRVWAGNGAVWAERVPFSGPAVLDSLAPADTTGMRLHVFHGGRRIQNIHRYRTWAELHWTAGGWVQRASFDPDDDFGDSGAWNSALGYDHDDTSWVSVGGSQVPGGFQWSVYHGVGHWENPTVTLIHTIPRVFRSGPDSTSMTCFRQSRLDPASCIGPIPSNVYGSKSVAAMSPMGDRAFVAIVSTRTQYQTKWFEQCAYDLNSDCAFYDEVIAPADSTEIIEVDLVSRVATPRWKIPGQVFKMAISERNDELVVAEGNVRRRNHGGPNDVNTYPLWYTYFVTYDQRTCALTFLDIRKPLVSMDVNRRVSVHAAGVCDPDGHDLRDGSATVAPRTVAPFLQRR